MTSKNFCTWALALKLGLPSISNNETLNMLLGLLCSSRVAIISPIFSGEKVISEGKETQLLCLQPWRLQVHSGEFVAVNPLVGSLDNFSTLEPWLTSIHLKAVNK